MEESWHISKSGVPTKCRASIKTCPRKETDPHFSNRAEAENYLFKKFTEKEKILRKIEKKKLMEESSENFGRPESLPYLAPKRFLNESEINLVSTEGLKCPQCEKEITAKQLASLLSNYDPSSEKCSYCSKELDLNRGGIKISVPDSKETSRIIQNPEMAREMKWYHSTKDINWIDNLRKEKFPFHVGSYVSALDRQFSDLEMDSDGKDQVFYLYEMELSNSAVISDQIFEDQGDNWDWKTERVKANVIPYLNAWEDSASVSLYLKSNMIKNVRMRRISWEEWMSYPTAYRIPEK